MFAPPTASYFPYLKTGDLLLNLIVFRSRMLLRRDSEISAKEIRGTHGARHLLLGTDAQLVAERVLGDKATAPNILLRNTLFGVYCRGMSRQMMRKWQEGILAARLDETGRCLGVSRHGFYALFPGTLRFCASCAATEWDSIGLATWKVLHQVASVDRCVEHGEGLSFDLSGRSILGRRIGLRFPGEQRANAPKEAPCALPMSEGYGAYLQIWPEVLAGSVPLLESTSWMAVVQEFISGCGGLPSAIRAVEREIARQWGVPCALIADRLGFEGGPQFVDQELSLKTRPKDLGRRVFVLTLLGGLGYKIGAMTQQQDSLRMPSQQGSEQLRLEHAIERLTRMIDEAALPLALSQVLCDREVTLPIAQIGARVGQCKQNIYEFVRTIPLDLLDDLRSLWPAEATPWIDKELINRRANGPS